MFSIVFHQSIRFHAAESEDLWSDPHNLGNISEAMLVQINSIGAIMAPSMGSIVLHHESENGLC